VRDPAAAFPLPSQRDDAADRRAANRAVAVSAAGLAATGIIELLLAVITGSVGLLGDAIHNLSDVSTSAVVFPGFRLSRRAPSERYPYGLERAEDLAGIGIAIVIWTSAAFAGYESIRKLIGHGHTTHVGAGIAAASIAIIGNQAVARYKLVTASASARPPWSPMPGIPGWTPAQGRPEYCQVWQAELARSQERPGEPHRPIRETSIPASWLAILGRYRGVDTLD
jgi:hypothetical protein